MGLLEEVAAIEDRSRIFRCPVGLYLRDLDPEGQSELEAVLGSEHRHTSIATALGGRGVDISAEAIGAHRRGKCRCRSLMT